ARDRLAYLVDAMARYDVHVANYYFRRGAYLAAANRAQQVVREFKDAPAVEDALYIMMRSYDALGMPELRDDTARVFKHNFPNSELVASGGKRKEKKAPWWQLW
ncbi:MAG: outer membrane protein assembly factor BamD, partial [Burkholderiaceae bacterium]